MMPGADAGHVVAAPGDPILPAGFQLVAFDTIDSTNDEAKRLASAGAAHGTTIWAREQSAGRGRQDRHWSSPRGNLFVSVILRPQKPPSKIAALGFVAALAVLHVVRRSCPDHAVRLKWPNDVLVDGTKIAGILLESSMSYPDTVDWLILGIGINLITAPAETPYKAAALAEFTTAPSTEQALSGLVTALDHWLKIFDFQGFAAIREAWLENGPAHGSRMTVREGSGATDGVFIGLDHDGALLLKTANGLCRITAGDVHLPAA